MHYLSDINVHYTISFFIALLQQPCDIVFPEAIRFLNKDIDNIYSNSFSVSYDATYYCRHTQWPWKIEIASTQTDNTPAFL